MLFAVSRFICNAIGFISQNVLDGRDDPQVCQNQSRSRIVPHLKVYFVFYSNKGLFGYFYMIFKPRNSLILALQDHRGHIHYGPGPF